jgi:hypothetical protein
LYDFSWTQSELEKFGQVNLKRCGTSVCLDLAKSIPLEKRSHPF